MSHLSTADRAKLPRSAFADPTRRLFPILDQADVDAAAHLIGRAHNPAAVKRRIIAIAHAKGFTLPTAWTADVITGTAMLHTALHRATHGR